MPGNITEKLWQVRAKLLRIILRAETENALYGELCRECVGVGGMHMAWVGVAAEGLLRPVAWAGAGAREYAQGAVIELDTSSPLAAGPSGQAYSTGALIVCNDYRSDPRTQPWHVRAAEFGVQSSAALPLRRGSTVIGVLNLYARQSHAFDAHLQELLGELLDDLALGLDHVRRFAEHGRLKHEAEENLQQMRRVFDLLPAFVVIVSPRAHFLEVNSCASDFFGLRREQILGRTVAELGVGIVARDREAVLRGLDTTGKVQNFETQLIGAEGRVIDVVTNIARIQYHGEPANLHVSVDVTERNRAVELLARNERHLTALVESASDAIVGLDASGMVIVFNQKAVEMFGVSKAQALGQPIDRFIPARSRGAHASHVQGILADTTDTKRHMGISRTVHGLRADGAEFPVEATLSVVGEGAWRMATVIVRDMTVFQQVEHARVAALEASAVAAAKAAFFSRMSHELRTPLTAVLGYSQLLAESARSRLNPADREKLHHVLRAGSQLRSLVDDVLSLSQVQSSQIKLALEAVDAAELLEAVLHMSLPEAAQRGVTLTIDPPADTAPRLHTDPLRLRQVLLNLVSNALKYNHPGGWVRLGIELRNDALRLSVIDNGMGMSQAQLAQLFQPFNRLGRERSGVEGTGLGLALVRELVELLGGGIGVQSREGEGTRVDVSLPLLAQDQPGPAGTAALSHASTESMNAARGVVLYIEDNEINAMLVAELFERMPGVRLELASSGAQGLSKASTVGPDLVLLDMHLPDMHGCAVLQELRRDDALRDVPVVALSASAMPEDVGSALAAPLTTGPSPSTSSRSSPACCGT